MPRPCPGDVVVEGHQGHLLSFWGRIAYITSASLTVIALPLGTSGGMDSEWRGGCFDLKAAKVSSLLLAMESSEHARRTAPLKSRSSNVSETLLANSCSGSWGLRVEGLAFLRPRGTSGVTLLSQLMVDMLSQIQASTPSNRDAETASGKIVSC